MRKIITFLLIFYAFTYAQEIGARYLIITHDNFYDAVQPLAQWKHKKGMRTKVAKLSETGFSSSQIRNYVINAYNNWQIRPEFLLLVGAPNYLPFGYISGEYTDNYYTNMEGNIYNEILSGRLTVHNTTEAQTVVNKILSYERTPYMDDSLWMINACLIVNEDYDPSDSIYWSDIHHAKDLMLGAGYNIIDTLSRAAGDNRNDILQCVNNGRGFVLYRGTGFNNWYWPFDVNPDQTQNGEKLPIVLSITCQTIGTSASPNYAEKWHTTGTPSTPRGASGYFATTTVVWSQAYLRSAVSKGFFDAVFTDGKRTFGEACEGGRIRVYQMYQYQGGDDEYYGFTTLGDPEMNIWTATPKPIEVLHDSSLAVGDESLYVMVTMNSEPLESALVCIVLDTLIYQYEYTSDLGAVTFYFDTLFSGFMDITVTGRNVIPYEGTIDVGDVGVREQELLNNEQSFGLAVYPNPCKGITNIKYSLGHSVPSQGNEFRPEGENSRFAENPRLSNGTESIELKIYDVTGKLIRDFSLPTAYSLLPTTVTWDGTDDIGRNVPEGIYFIYFSTENYEKSEKIILLR